MTQKNISLRFEWLEIIDPLAFDEQMEVINAVARFCRTGEVVSLSPYANEKFVKYILPTLQKRRKAAETRARRKERMAAAKAAAERAAQAQPSVAEDVKGEDNNAVADANASAAPVTGVLISSDGVILERLVAELPRGVGVLNGGGTANLHAESGGFEIETPAHREGEPAFRL